MAAAARVVELHAHAALGAPGALPQQDRRRSGNDHATCKDDEPGPWQRNEDKANNDERHSDAEHDLQHAHTLHRFRGGRCTFTHLPHRGRAGSLRAAGVAFLEDPAEEAAVIPTMILFGLLLGRWWKFALIVGTSAWTVLLWSQGLLATPPEIVGAAALALVNTAVGVLAHQLVLAVVRRVRGHQPTAVEATR